jgi:hypothetical protein
MRCLDALADDQARSGQELRLRFVAGHANQGLAHYDAATRHELCLLRSGRGGEVADSSAVLAAALESLGTDALALRARLLASLSRAQHFLGEPERSRSTLTEAVSLARASGDAMALYEALHAKFFARDGFVLPRDSKWAVTMSFIAEVCARLGDAPRAKRHFEATKAAAKRLDIPADVIVEVGQFSAESFA